MKIKELTYSKTFGIPGSKDPFEKIMLVAELEEGEDCKKVFYELKKTANDLHYESENAAKKKEQEIIPQTPEQRIGLDVADIYSVTDLRVLEQSYKYLVKNKPVLQAAYDMQYKKLSQ